MAVFGNSAGVMTRVMASSCQGDTTAGGPICPGQAQLSPNAMSVTTNVSTAEKAI